MRTNPPTPSYILPHLSPPQDCPPEVPPEVPTLSARSALPLPGRHLGEGWSLSFAPSGQPESLLSCPPASSRMPTGDPARQLRVRKRMSQGYFLELPTECPSIWQWLLGPVWHSSLGPFLLGGDSSPLSSPQMLHHLLSVHLALSTPLQIVCLLNYLQLTLQVCHLFSPRTQIDAHCQGLTCLNLRGESTDQLFYQLTGAFPDQHRLVELSVTIEMP